MRFTFLFLQPIRLADRGLRLLIGSILLFGGLAMIVLVLLFLKALWFG